MEKERAAAVAFKDAAASSSSASGARKVVKVEKKEKKKTPATTQKGARQKWEALIETQYKGKTMDLTFANLLKPPRTVLYEDPIEKRARAFYTIAGTPQRLSEQCLLSTGQTFAWVFVLKFAWEQYCADYPDQECPWDWEKVDLSAVAPASSSSARAS